MRIGNHIQDKIFSLQDMQRKIAQWRVLHKTVAFTNGCFDILHAGHIASLTQAANSADYLIVAVNADASVKKLKGPDRPVQQESTRALILASLTMVDAVIIFSEDTPLETIVALRPNVLVKGGDYKIEEIAGSKEVLSWGGQVIINPILQGFSTSSIIHQTQQFGKTDNSNPKP